MRITEAHAPFRDYASKKRFTIFKKLNFEVSFLGKSSERRIASKRYGKVHDRKTITRIK